MQTSAGRSTQFQATLQSEWVKPLRDEGNATHLVCFPFAGGGVGPYRPWTAEISSAIDISAVLLPGREQRLLESPIGCPTSVCEAITRELLGVIKPGTKIVFFGHSMGSLLAYDIAVRLKKQHNIDIAMLIASGRQAPHVNLGGDIHKSDEQTFIRELKRMGGTPDIVFEDDELRGLVIPMLRSDYQILETYAPEKFELLDCPILTCTGDVDTEVSPDELAGWSELTHNAVIHEVFSGDHFYLTDNIQRNRLTSVIEHYINVML